MEIAGFASRLTARQAQTIVGLGARPASRVMILFDEATIGGVLGAFAEEARALWGGECSTRDVWAVASRHNLPGKKGAWLPRSLVDYHPAYRSEGGSRSKANLLCRQLQKAAVHHAAARPPAEVGEMLAVGVSGLARAHGWKAMNDRPITAHNVWATLSQRDLALPRAVRRLLRDHVLAGDAVWEQVAWLALMEQLLPLFSPHPQGAEADVAEFYDFVAEQKADLADPERRSTKQVQFDPPPSTIHLGTSPACQALAGARPNPELTCWLDRLARADQCGRTEMNISEAATGNAKISELLDFDAVVIGAGVTGLYQLYRLRELGLRVRTFEAASGVGGTWYWNRYPGARFDSESWTYGYSFSKELLEEWDWSEHFAPQPETERYLNHVADKFDLRRDIQFNTRVSAAHYREDTRSWDIVLGDGSRVTARFLITAIGILSAPTMPNIPGVAAFEGQSCHTHDWPKEGVDFTGKRVGIIGTGATAVQTIQEIAKSVGHLTVFQRTPNWCAPLNNGKISKDEMGDIRTRYPDILALCRQTPGCYIHSTDPRTTMDATPEERIEFWEKLYASPGFGIWQGNFSDMLTDRAANALASEFIANKIRQRVHDPVVAEKLIPKNHGFGTRRVPLETGYYEVFNQPNVELVDVSETPIECATRGGIQTSAREYAFDIIIYATGFDAISGAFDRIDIRGNGGVRLKDVWANGPQTYLGVFVENFPNLLMTMGPHAGLGNYTRTAEYSVDWVTDVIRHAMEHALTRVEATAAGVGEWTDYVHALGQGHLMNEVGSWMTGVNRNVEGKQVPRIMRYSGGHPAYREHCDAVAAADYRQLALD